MSSRVFSSSSTPPSSGSRSRPLPWTAPPPCKENTLWYLHFTTKFSFYKCLSLLCPWQLNHPGIWLRAFLMFAFSMLYIHLCSFHEWMQWLDSSFPCRRSIYHITCALLKIQLHSSSRLVNFPPRPCEQHIICSRYIGWVITIMKYASKDWHLWTCKRLWRSFHHTAARTHHFSFSGK